MPDLNLDILRRAFPDEDAVAAADVVHDRLVEPIPPDGNIVRHDHAAHGQDGNIADAAADIDNHVSDGGAELQPCAQRRRARLVDKVGAARARLPRGIHDGAHLHLADTGRDADDDARGNPHPPAGAADEVFEHLERDLILSHGSVRQRAGRLDMLRRAPQHLHGASADLHNPVGCRVYGDDGRLIEHDSLSLNEHQHARRAEIHGDIPAPVLRFQLCKTESHTAISLLFVPVPRHAIRGALYCKV